MRIRVLFGGRVRCLVLIMLFLLAEGRVLASASDSYTGLKNIDGIWYYVQNDTIKYDYTGLVPYYSTTYYVRGGKVDWNYTGLVLDNGEWCYVERGIHNFYYDGLVKYYSTWYYVRDGYLDWNYSGLTRYYSTWYYVNNGILDMSYTGFTKYYSTWYAVRNGVMSDAFNHLNAWASGKTSNTDYLIVVSRAKHEVAIFQGTADEWRPVKYVRCTTGEPWTPTYAGDFCIDAKYSYFDSGSVRCWYASSFDRNHGILFHSVLYVPDSGPYVIDDPTLGEDASHGCVRLWLSDAKYIYDNVPIGTRVLVY